MAALDRGIALCRWVASAAEEYCSAVHDGAGGVPVNLGRRIAVSAHSGLTLVIGLPASAKHGLVWNRLGFGERRNPEETRADGAALVGQASAGELDTQAQPLIAADSPATKTRRIQAIDATRGAAMFFVCLSHFAFAYLFVYPEEKRLLAFLFQTTMIAAPTFMVISGIMLGFLYRTHRHDFSPIRLTLIDRGLFLLTVARVPIVLAHIPTAGGLRAALRWTFATDAIAFSIIVGAVLVSRVRALARVMGGAALVTVCWIFLVWWHPTGFGGELVKETLFGHYGAHDPHVYADHFPFLPWFGFYLLSSGIGEGAGKMVVGGTADKLPSYFFSMGLLSLGGALVLRSVPHVLRDLHVFPNGLGESYHAFITYQKLPPSPVYFLFYGGLGLLVTSLFAALENRPWAKPLLRLAGMAGQTSLAVFVAQYFVYFSVLRWLKLPLSSFWPLYFLASLFPLLLVSKFWHHINGNRFFTVKYTALDRWLFARSAYAGQQTR